MTEKTNRSNEIEKPSSNTGLLSRVSTVSLGVAVSVVVAKVFIPAADANPDLQVQSDVIENSVLQTKNTAVAEAVVQGIGKSTDPDVLDEKLPVQVTSESTVKSTQSTDQGDFLSSRTNELIAGDNRAVDEVAARLKEIIRARYSAENENIQSLNTIDDLRARLVEVENSLQNTHAKNESLSAEQTALEEKISQVTIERDEALNNIDAISVEMEEHISSVQALKAETQNTGELLNSKEQSLAELNDQLKTLTVEREEALAEAGVLADRLSQSETELNSLTSQLESINLERDDAVALTIELQNELSSRDNSLQELNTRLDTEAQDRATAESTISELQLSVGDKESTVVTMQNELSEKDNLLEGLKMQIQLLSEEKDNTINQVAEIDSLLNLKTESIAELELQLASQAAESSEALESAQSSFENLSSELQSTIGEREDAIELSNVLQSELSDKENSLLELNAQLESEIQNRANAQATIAELQLSLDEKQNTVVAAQDELAEKENLLSNLQVQIEQLNSEKDGSTSKIAEIDSLLNLKTDNIADLEYKLASLKTEKDQALEKVNLLQDELASAESAAGEIISDKNNLSDKIKLLETQNADVNNALVEEQKVHVQSKAVLTALQSETSRLEAEVDELVGERDALLSDVSQQKSTSAELYSSQQELQKKLEARQSDLEIATKALSALNDDIAAVTGERDTAVTTIENLNAEVVLLKNDFETARSEHRIVLDSAHEDFAQQKTELDTILAARDGEITELNEKIIFLTGDMEKQKESLQLKITERDGSITQLQKKVAAVKSDRDQLEKLHKSGSAKLVKMASEASGFAKSQDVSDQHIAELESLNGDLDSQLASLKKELERVTAEYTQNTAQLNKDIDELRLAHTDLGSREQTALKKIKTIETDNKKLREKLSLSQSQHGSAEEQLESLKLNLISYEKELNVSNARLDDLVHANTIVEEDQKRTVAKMDSLRRSLMKELGDAELENVSVQDTREDNSIPIKLGNADFFAPGSGNLTSEGRIKLSKLADIIRSYAIQRIVVEGHTDATPIGVGLKDRFESNWELSVTRAAAAVRHLQAFTGLEPGSLSAAGFGEFRPLANNETEAGRKQNRRVEIVLYPIELEYERVSSTEE